MRRSHELFCAAVLIVVCCGARLYGLSPFGTPMFLALAPIVFIGFTAPLYIACSFLFTFELWRLYLSAAVVLIAAVRWFIGLKAPRVERETAKILFSVGAIFVETVLMGLFCPIVETAMSGVLSAVFYYFARYVAFDIERKFGFRLSATESAAVCVTMFVAGLTFARAKVGVAEIGLGLGFLSALFLCAIGVKAALGGGIAIGIGFAVGSDLRVALAFIGAVAIAVAFRAMPRPLYAVMGIGIFAALSVLFGVNAVRIGWNALMLAAAAALYCVLPRRAVKTVRDYFDFDGAARLAVRHYINRTRLDAGNKMLLLSSVFDETARLMSAFGGVEPDGNALGAALADKFCPYCKNQALCDEAKRAASFKTVAERAYAGASVITDLPEFFTTECIRTSDVISVAAGLTDAAHDRQVRQESDRKAREAVVERLVAVKDVLGEMGRNEATPVGFDKDRENKIKSALNYSGIECAEVFATAERITAVVRTAATDADKLSRALKGYCVESLDKSSASGWSIAELKKKAPFEAVYARAGVAKSGGVSGDSYAFRRIGDKFLVALADGMGYGDGAAADSAAAIELIECFYRAGFKSDSALSGVNKFLKVGGESFSAADVAICDLETGRVDIVKIGSPACYIKTQDTVLKIEGKSLPIGMLDEMRPYSTSKMLRSGQMLVIVSDGVSDCFSGDTLPEYLNNITAHNPKAAAEAVLNRALVAVGNQPRDDMTVIAFRLYST